MNENRDLNKYLFNALSKINKDQLDNILVGNFLNTMLPVNKIYWCRYHYLDISD